MDFGGVRLESIFLEMEQNPVSCAASLVLHHTLCLRHFSLSVHMHVEQYYLDY